MKDALLIFVSKLYLCVLLMLFIPNVHAVEKNEHVSIFFGPNIGEIYFYKVTNGPQIVVSVISVLNKFSVKIEERIILPEDDGNYEKSIHANTYTQFIEGNKLKRISEKGEEILLIEPIVTDEPLKWKMQGVLISNNNSTMIESICMVNSISNETIFDMSRKTVSVKCEMSNDSVVTVYKYAEGIGLIKKSLEAFDKNGTSYGVIYQELYKIQKK